MSWFKSSNSLNLPSLTGRNFIVSGCATGLGREVALYLARSGCNLALLDINKEEIQSLLKELAALSDGAKEAKMRFHFVFAAIDITNADAVKRFVFSASKTFENRLSGLVHCASINPHTSAVSEMKLELLDEMLDVNIKGTFHLNQAVIQALEKQTPDKAPEGGYSIVNVGSSAGLQGVAGSALFAACSHAINGFTKSLAKEVAGYNIRCNVVAPGAVDNSYVRQLADSIFAPSTIPLERKARGAEVAAVVAFLLSEQASYVTGSVYECDGGATA